MKTANPLYVHSEDVHNTRAAEIVLPILFEYVQPQSILDVGCGTGTWLKVFNDMGISDFTGVDGNYVDRSMLQIAEERFVAHDLTKPLNLGRIFDLAVSLEVAEHLPESAADVFVASLTKHSKTILFSAAIPGQGGQNHLNEQWPAYWQEKFRRYGYEYYDIIRPAVWNNERVDIWYRQNMFLVCHENVKPDFPIFKGDNLIHPKFWQSIEKLRQQVNDWQTGAVGVDLSLKTLGKAIGKKASKLF